MKAGKIAYARFNMKISSDNLNSDKVYTALKELLESEEIMLEKKSKSGYKTVDLKKSIKNYSLSENVILPSLKLYFPQAVPTTQIRTLLSRLWKMLRAKNFTPILRERIYIILIWNYLDKLCLHLQFAMQIHTKQF